MKTACGIDRIVIDAAGGFDREAITGDVIINGPDPADRGVKSAEGPAERSYAGLRRRLVTAAPAFSMGVGGSSITSPLVYLR